MVSPELRQLLCGWRALEGETKTSVYIFKNCLGNHLKGKILRPTPRSSNSLHWEQDPIGCIITSSPGASDAGTEQTPWEIRPVPTGLVMDWV